MCVFFLFCFLFVCFVCLFFVCFLLLFVVVVLFFFFFSVRFFVMELRPFSDLDSLANENHVSNI